MFVEKIVTQWVCWIGANIKYFLEVRELIEEVLKVRV